MKGVGWISVTSAVALLMGCGLSLGLGGSATASGAGQADLNGLAERVTIRVQPTIVGPRATTRVTVFGSAEGARAGEDISIQGKNCGGASFFRVVSGAVTRADGSWSTFYFTGRTITLRAVWRDETSAQVTIRGQAIITIRKRGSRRIEVTAHGSSRFWRKRATIQRFDNRLGAWSTVRTVVLTESYGPPRGSLGGQGAFADFTLPVAKGTLIRALLPRSQAGPCWLPGISNSIRT
jgi:hypothetical protein